MGRLGLDVVGERWAALELGRATEFAVHAYAPFLVDPAAVAAADAWLADPRRPQALRRLVRDGRDHQARAVAARAAGARAGAVSGR